MTSEDGFTANFSVCYITCMQMQLRMEVIVRGCAHSSDLDGSSAPTRKAPGPNIRKNEGCKKHPQNCAPKFKMVPEMGFKKHLPKRGPRVSCPFLIGPLCGLHPSKSMCEKLVEGEAYVFTGRKLPSYWRRALQ